MAVGLIGLAFYLRTLPPGLTWAHDSADGGELAAAAYTLGIPHPPGYPTYVLLAHPFTRLPLGEVATRTNLFSALCAAAAASVLAWTVARVTDSLPAACGAGVALALSPLLWSQAVVTEVHALNTLIACLLLSLAISSRAPTYNALHPGAAGLVWGLGLGNHLTIVLCAPLVTLVPRRRLRSALLGVAGLAVGLTVYLYLPLRASTNPPLSWGDPRSLDRFLWTVSGSLYHQFAFSLPPAHLPARLLAWAALLTSQFSPLGLVVCLLGAATLTTEDRALFVASFRTLVLCSAFAIGYNTTDSYLYLLPTLPCLGLWLGQGMARLISASATRTRWAAAVCIALAVLLPIALGVSRLPQIDLSDDRSVYEFREVALVEAPPGAIVVSQQDRHTFALWYFRYAIGQRSDVAVVDSALLGYDWYSSQLLHYGGIPASAHRLLAGPDEDLAQAVRALNRPVCRIPIDGTGLECFN